MEVAQLAVDVVKRLVRRQARAKLGKGEVDLDPTCIGLCATHRVMNAAMELRLPRNLRRKVKVDTPERWQGLQLPVMVIAHPLSGVLHPSDFDLETGRRCVMASRHQAGLIIVTRDHVGETLDTHLPVSEQPVGRPDVAGRGHYQHSAFWNRLVITGRVIEA